MSDGLTEPVPFRTLVHTTHHDSHHRGHPTGLFIVDTEREWADVWDQPSAPTRAAVRWGYESVLVMALGGRPSSGFEVTVYEVGMRGTEVQVYVREARPAGAVLDIFTCPLHAIVIPQLTLGAPITLVQRIATSTD